jgi:hypothetical protein
MAKATPLTGDIMNTGQSDNSTLQPRPPIKEVKKPAKTETITPLQIRLPSSQVKAIKRAALEADQTVSEYMLACFHAYKNS